MTDVMYEKRNIFCKVNKLNMNHDQRQELLNIATSIDYNLYLIEKDGTPDNNYIQQAGILPDWFNEKAKDFLEVGWTVFLKNKGDVPWHTDDKRKSSITIPLNNSSTPTLFKNGFETYSLYHNLDPYLQNNEQEHSVPKANKERYFLQISFDKPYSEIRKMI